MSDCVFCKIVKGEIPCFKLYEDRLTLAFLDINPVSKGHALIIPKEHAALYHEMSDESAKAMGVTVKKVSAAIQAAFNCDFNILNNNGALANQAVHHVHVHIIPRRGKDGEFSFEWDAKKYEPGEDIKVFDEIKKKL